MGNSALGKTIVAIGVGLIVFIAAASFLAEKFPHNAWYYIAGGK